METDNKARWSLMFRQSKVELQAGRFTSCTQPNSALKGKSEDSRNQGPLAIRSRITGAVLCNLHPQVIQPRDNQTCKSLRWFRFVAQSTPRVALASSNFLVGKRAGSVASKLQHRLTIALQPSRETK